MIVMVPVDAERRGRLRSENADIGRVLRHVFGLDRTADMAVEADDTIAAGRDDVEIVRHEDNAEVMLVTQAADQIVEISLARKVDVVLVSHDLHVVNEK